MIQYSADGLTAFYSGYKFRKDKKTGYFLCSRKTDAGKRERLHNFVWRLNYGDIPAGYQIHHKDGNKNNNKIGNLQALKRSEHMSLHAHSWTEERLERQREIVVTKANPAAVKWHKSKEGHDWHVQNGKNATKNLTPVEHVCVNCGGTFTTIHRYKKGSNCFCSNNCKAAYRRKSGVDDIEKICKVCGSKFQSNKYANTTRCSSCRHRKHNTDRNR